jgi:hypothetical protein
MRSEDLFAAYRYWCHQTNSKAPSLITFISETAKRPGVHKARRRHYGPDGVRQLQSTVLTPPDVEQVTEMHALSEQIDNFADSVKAWRRQGGDE